MKPYGTIVNPETKEYCSINENNGANILAKYIKQYQTGGKPCSNCGKRRPRHNMRTCKAPGAHYWRKLSKKKRDPLLINKPNNKTRGDVAIITYGSIYTYYFFKKNEYIPPYIRKLFEKSTIEKNDCLNLSYKLCIGDKYELDEKIASKIIKIDDKNTYKFKSEEDALTICSSKNIPFNEVYDNHYIKGPIDNKYILYIGKWQILRKNEINLLFGEKKFEGENKTDYKLSEDDKLPEDGNLTKKLEKFKGKNHYIIVMHRYPGDLWNVRNQLNSQSGYEYIAFIMDNTYKQPEIVGYAEALDILDEAYLHSWYGDEKIEDYSSLYKTFDNAKKGDYSIYISNVRIHPNYIGKHLCKPLVKHLISELKNKFENKNLFIENASVTKNGVPACFCYYKAGDDLGYTIEYNSEDESGEFNIKEMTGEFCKDCGDDDGKNNKCQTTYYYTSPNI